MLIDGRVSHGWPTELLSDAELVSSARLRQPLVLRAAAELGLGAEGITDIGSLVRAVRAVEGAA